MKIKMPTQANRTNAKIKRAQTRREIDSMAFKPGSAGDQVSQMRFKDTVNLEAQKIKSKSNLTNKKRQLSDKYDIQKLETKYSKKLKKDSISKEVLDSTEFADAILNATLAGDTKLVKQLAKANLSAKANSAELLKTQRTNKILAALGTAYATALGLEGLAAAQKGSNE